MEYKELYKIITQFYPLGLDELDIGYSEYPGIKRFLDRGHVMFNYLNYEGKWKTFIDRLTPEINGIQEVSWESPPSEWCYTGSFVISNRNRNGITHTKEFVINVSFLAPVYTVYGRDRIECVEDGSLMEFNPFLTISPLGSYEKLFPFFRGKIEREYLGYRFIPFNLLSEKVKSIYVPGLINGQDSTVYQALFKLHDITNFPCQGDPLYE